MVFPGHTLLAPVMAAGAASTVAVMVLEYTGLPVRQPTLLSILHDIVLPFSKALVEKVLPVATSAPFTAHVYIGVPAFTDAGVNTILVPGQNAPLGLAVIDTDAVTGAVTDKEAKFEPLVPIATPDMPDTDVAYILPAAADVVSGCTCNPKTVN
jgi:hypothetical protein